MKKKLLIGVFAGAVIGLGAYALGKLLENKLDGMFDDLDEEDDEDYFFDEEMESQLDREYAEKKEAVCPSKEEAKKEVLSSEEKAEETTGEAKVNE